MSVESQIIEYAPIHQHFEVVESTQDLVKKEALNKINSPNDLLIITAGAQNSGRGVKGDKWHAPVNTNFLGSFGFILPKNKNTILRLMPIIGALAVRDFLNRYKVSSTIKWVNDVLVDGRKISGVLVENLTWNQNSDYKLCIVGIGLNINMTETELEVVDQPSTSLLAETGMNHDLEKVSEEFISIFKNNLQQL